MKFKYNDKVRVIDDFYQGVEGRIVDYYKNTNRYTLKTFDEEILLTLNEDLIEKI